MENLTLSTFFVQPSSMAGDAAEKALVVMARYPEPGRVKTRLAATIGPAAAAGVYRAFLADLRDRLGADPRWKLLWAFEPRDSPFGAEIARGAPAFAQPEGDLGGRMSGAITEALRRGYQAVVLVGSDMPHLGPETVAEAFDKLARGAKLVLGPAEDGGYFLVGARSVPPIFESIEWGGSGVLVATLERARAAGFAPELLAAGFDVDTAADLERLGGEISAGRVRGLEATPAALEWLRRLRYT